MHSDANYCTHARCIPNRTNLGAKLPQNLLLTVHPHGSTAENAGEVLRKGG
jgi:hypothetical protein